MKTLDEKAAEYAAGGMVISMTRTKVTQFTLQ